MPILIAFLCGLARITTVVDSNPATLGAEDLRCFAWFDTLGFPNLSLTPFVRISSGIWSHGSAHPEKADEEETGFLLKDNGLSFTIFHPDELATRTYSKLQSGTNKYEIWRTYVKANLKKEATTYLQQISQPETDRNLSQLNESELSEFTRRIFRRFSERGALFVWARALAAQNQPNLAKQFLIAARKKPAWQSQENATTTFCDTISSEIAHTLMWEAVLEFGDPHISRNELLTRFRLIVDHFPKSEEFSRARETASVLESMVAEDEAHARLPVKSNDMKVKEKVAELIFRLRDQNGLQMTQPGSCDIFANDRFLRVPNTDKSPAMKLVEIGNDAVPLLKEAINDKRFSRSVCYWRSFTFSHRVLTVGECATIILERIGNKSRFVEGSLIEQDNARRP